MDTIAAVDARSIRVSGKTVWTFVRARDSFGRTGWGEATLQGRHRDVHAHVERRTRSLVGATAAAPARESWGAGVDMADAAAQGGIDQALWDLASQAAGVPLARMLGAPTRGVVPLYANVNRGTLDRTPAGFAARAREAAEAGFCAVKIAPFDDVTPERITTPEGRRLVEAGLDRVRAVREAIGDARALMVDCHWRLTEDAAAGVLRALEPETLFWLECPLVEDDASLPALKRLRSLANGLGTRLAGCESMTGVDAFRAFLDAGAYDAIMPDVKYAGGLAELMRIAEEAERRAVACSPHNPTGPIAHLASVHASASIASLPFLEFQYGESPLFFDIVAGEMPDPRGGSSEVPRGAGLGAGLDPAKLDALAADGAS